MPPANPTLYDIGLFIAIAFFILAGINSVLKLIDHFKVKPPIHDQYVKLDTCKEHRLIGKAGIDKDLEELKKEVGSDRKGRSEIHRDVRRLEERVSKSEGIVSTINQRQITQDGKLDKILSELGEVKGQLKPKT